MQATSVKFKTVDEYISSLPADKQKAVKEVRKVVCAAAPGAEEVISYNMPALRLHGMLLYYAAWKDHLGFYGISSSILDVFKKELSAYKQSKGTIQFPLGQLLPTRLITKMVQYRVKENREKAEAKKKKTK
jgi:uncharacterized protein YdhG (YjbR/CyaY superfamily)